MVIFVLVITIISYLKDKDMIKLLLSFQTGLITNFLLGISICAIISNYIHKNKSLGKSYYYFLIFLFITISTTLLIFRIPSLETEKILYHMSESYQFSSLIMQVILLQTFMLLIIDYYKLFVTKNFAIITGFSIYFLITICGLAIGSNSHVIVTSLILILFKRQLRSSASNDESIIKKTYSKTILIIFVLIIIILSYYIDFRLFDIDKLMLSLTSRFDLAISSFNNSFVLYNIDQEKAYNYAHSNIIFILTEYGFLTLNLYILILCILFVNLYNYTKRAKNSVCIYTNLILLFQFSILYFFAIGLVKDTIFNAWVWVLFGYIFSLPMIFKCKEIKKS